MGRTVSVRVDILGEVGRLSDNATVLDSDKIRTDDGREISGLARMIEEIDAKPGDRVEVRAGPDDVPVRLFRHLPD